MRDDVELIGLVAWHGEQYAEAVVTGTDDVVGRVIRTRRS